MMNQDQESDHQDVEVEGSPEESKDSCHDPLHMKSTLCSQIFGDLLAPEVMYCQTLLFILKITWITQAMLKFFFF